MNVQLEPGKYIVAVSGGVDSMSLLHVLKDLPCIEIIVAHFDHGIRTDSAEDAKLVRKTAEVYGLAYELGEGRLGTDSSEATARKARYDFLSGLQEKYGARAIVTAHHRDDVLETAILNLLRGTGRKGLSSLSSRGDVVRPLLGISKDDIRSYAEANKITWREDSTNDSDRYARNYVRSRLVPRFSSEKKAEFLAVIERGQVTNAALDAAIGDLLQQQETLDRHTLIMLPHVVAREVIAVWLRKQHIREFDRQTIERLVVAAKTGRQGSRANIYGRHMLIIDKHKLALSIRDR